MSIPFIDLKSQSRRVEDKVRKNLDTVLEHGMFIMGPEVRAFEERMEEFCGVKHAVGCASGTDALTMALMALGAGPGDAVFTTPFTFVATAETIALAGANPIFVDVDPMTYNIDPEELIKKIEFVRNEIPELTPKGVIAVDIFGQPADYERIQAICDEYDLFLIADSAQSCGATHNGKHVCAMGDIACTSFFPAKPLGCYGDGGMCFTNNDELKELLHSVRVHGQGSNKYENVRLGITGRLDSMQAAVLDAKLDIFPDEIRTRNEAADRYAALLEPIAGIRAPRIAEGNVSTWAQYCVLAKDSESRDKYMAALKEAGIPSVIYYPMCLHEQKVFSELGYEKGDMPVSEDLSERIFALPMHPYLEAEVQEKIVAVLAAV